MTKEEIYTLLKYQIKEQSEALSALDQDVRAVLDALVSREGPAHLQDEPHIPELANATFAGIFRNDPELRNWLLSCGIDNFERFKTFIDGLTDERTAAIFAVAKKEGY